MVTGSYALIRGCDKSLIGRKQGGGSGWRWDGLELMAVMDGADLNSDSEVAIGPN